YNAVDEMKKEPFELKVEPFDEFGKIKQEDSGLQVSTIDAPNNIKEEPLEIKDEPLDDCQQEKHIADMFCPSTGISRPLDYFTSTINTDIASKSKAKRRKSRRADEIEERTRIFLQKRQKVKEEDILEARSVYASTDNLDAQLLITGQPNEIKEEPVEIKDEPIDEFAEDKLEEPIADEELDECTDKKKLIQPRKCYLCGEMALPWLITPKDPHHGHLFFMSLIELTDDQLELIDHLIKFNKRANICRKHYREPKVGVF
ncbi:hypothetical protein PMAYCL1PPCAC_01146, partial [Pristionchus mayeri]